MLPVSDDIVAFIVEFCVLIVAEVIAAEEVDCEPDDDDACGVVGACVVVVGACVFVVVGACVVAPANAVKSIVVPDGAYLFAP